MAAELGEITIIKNLCNECFLNTNARDGNISGATAQLMRAAGTQNLTRFAGRSPKWAA